MTRIQRSRPCFLLREFTRISSEIKLVETCLVSVMNRSGKYKGESKIANRRLILYHGASRVPLATVR